MKIIQPIIQLDTREQVPLVITQYPVEKIGLPVGDYGVKGFSDWTNPCFIVERKSIGDLVGSLTAGRERFMKEIEKMRQFSFRALIIEALRSDVQAARYRSDAAPASILATLDALSVRCNLHVFWCADAEGAALCLESLVKHFCTGIQKQYNLLTVREGSKNDE